MNLKVLNEHNIYAIPAGCHFGKEGGACYLVYSPLANQFFLSLPREVQLLEEALEKGEAHSALNSLLKQTPPDEGTGEVSSDTFCTLHLLLNEKCNFHCKYCYSAQGRSSAELTMEQIKSTLDYFLSAQRKAVKERTVMFMGGGEPMLSWPLVESATLYALEVARAQGIKVFFSLTTNGSILNDRMISFFKKHNFTIQVSFEILPDVQEEQRGSYEAVARNLKRLTEEGIDNYVRATITPANVDRIPQMVEHCHATFPKVTKMSCQQVVDTNLFTSVEVVRDFFERYFVSFDQAAKIATQYGITLRSSSSHLINYSKRERFCYNLLCLTPYGSFTTCPDVSSPNEADYETSLIGELNEGQVQFNEKAFERNTRGTIHTIDKCHACFAKWNCGSGCPSSRRVYAPEIFDAICDYYRKMLFNSLMEELSKKYKESTGKDLIADISAKL